MNNSRNQPSYDPNVLEKLAGRLLKAGRPNDAMKIYLFMADGDNSLDGGHLGSRIGRCLEATGDLHSAKFWYGRALEENPGISVYADDRRRLEGLNIDDLMPQDECDWKD